MSKSAGCVCTTTLVAVMMIFIIKVSADPDPLQDICVADSKSPVKTNGFVCKPSTNISPADFFSADLANPGKINYPDGSIVTAGNVRKIPGLNTLGISISRIDYAPDGINPPHTHPRATEIIFVLDGDLHVGFITTDDVLVNRTIHKGEVFVFPKGLVHFQQNVGKKNRTASVISAFDSQLPGTQSLARTLFGAATAVPDSVLAKTFRVGIETVKEVKGKFVKNKI